jgi:hypothetical protein
MRNFTEGEEAAPLRVAERRQERHIRLFQVKRGEKTCCFARDIPPNADGLVQRCGHRSSEFLSLKVSSCRPVRYLIRIFLVSVDSSVTQLLKYLSPYTRSSASHRHEHEFHRVLVVVAARQFGRKRRVVHILPNVTASLLGGGSRSFVS